MQCNLSLLVHWVVRKGEAATLHCQLVHPWSRDLRKPAKNPEAPLVDLAKSLKHLFLPFPRISCANRDKGDSPTIMQHLR
jgi:hypothetical protein